MPNITNYNRMDAISYANEWAMKRNPRYFDFGPYGGDCTNFISQCLYAGSKVMNYRPTFGWYYRSSYDRSPSWTSVEYLYNFLTTNKQRGVFAKEIPISQIELGDILQLADAEMDFYHTLIITELGDPPSPDNILLNAHDYDALHRPLFTYNYAYIRFLHIEGVYV